VRHFPTLSEILGSLPRISGVFYVIEKSLPTTSTSRRSSPPSAQSKAQPARPLLGKAICADDEYRDAVPLGRPCPLASAFKDAHCIPPCHSRKTLAIDWVRGFRNATPQVRGNAGQIPTHNLLAPLKTQKFPLFAIALGANYEVRSPVAHHVPPRSVIAFPLGNPRCAAFLKPRAIARAAPENSATQNTAAFLKPRHLSRCESSGIPSMRGSTKLNEPGVKWGCRAEMGVGTALSSPRIGRRVRGESQEKCASRVIRNAFPQPLPSPATRSRSIRQIRNKSSGVQERMNGVSGTLFRGFRNSPPHRLAEDQ
jgi:hypothetical protein